MHRVCLATVCRYVHQPSTALCLNWQSYIAKCCLNYFFVVNQSSDFSYIRIRFVYVLHQHFKGQRWYQVEKGCLGHKDSSIKLSASHGSYHPHVWITSVLLGPSHPTALVAGTCSRAMWRGATAAWFISPLCNPCIWRSCWSVTIEKRNLLSFRRSDYSQTNAGIAKMDIASKSTLHQSCRFNPDPFPLVRITIWHNRRASRATDPERK